MAAPSIYRALTLLYPRTFRARYREDLIRHHADLVDNFGCAAAWRRTGLDLIITVPTYRLESMMSARSATIVLNLVVVAFAASSIAIMLVGFPLGGVLLGVASIIAITQRTTIARSLRQPRRGPRGPRLAASAVCAAIAAGVFLVAFNDDEWGETGTLIYSIVFLAAAVASVGLLAAALATRRRPPTGAMIAG